MNYLVCYVQIILSLKSPVQNPAPIPKYPKPKINNGVGDLNYRKILITIKERAKQLSAEDQYCSPGRNKNFEPSHTPFGPPQKPTPTTLHEINKFLQTKL